VVAIAIAVALVTTAGCISTGLPPPTRVADPGLLDAPLRYACGALVFDPALFDEPGNAEQASTPQAQILRENIAQSAREGEPLPVDGWHLLADRPDGADYLATRPLEGEDVDIEVVSVTVRLGGVGFNLRAQRNRCRPSVVLPPGLNVGSWSLLPERPRPSDHEIRVAVHEEACASGRSPTGRIVGPAIEADNATVVILFAIVALEGAATCQGNPAGLETIDIGEPIGDRVLVDPSHWPWARVDL
jgi:hypothetical protein